MSYSCFRCKNPNVVLTDGMCDECRKEPMSGLCSVQIYFDAELLDQQQDEGDLNEFVSLATDKFRELLNATIDHKIATNIFVARTKEDLQ